MVEKLHMAMMVSVVCAVDIESKRGAIVLSMRSPVVTGSRPSRRTLVCRVGCNFLKPSRVVSLV